MAHKTFVAQYLSADISMTDVWLGAKALYRWCIATKDADIVQHCSLLNKLLVESQFGVLLSYQQTAVGHLT
jgi:hypothetical protein